MSYHYDYLPETHAGGGIIPLLFIGIWMVSMLLVIGLVAMQLISRWFIFKKMGMPGWKGIIPFYSNYQLFRTVWSTKAFWAYIIGMGVYYALYMVVYVFSVMSMVLTGMKTAKALPVVLIVMAAVMILLSVAFLVYALVIMFKLNNRLAKAFGKSTGFAVGLTLLEPIFGMILAFDKSVYRRVEG